MHDLQLDPVGVKEERGWIGKDRTNQRGKWRAPFNLGSYGRYYAGVVREKKGTAGTTFVCRRDVSPRHAFQRQG